MIAKQDTAIRFEAFFTKFGQGQTGLSPTIKISRDGSRIVNDASMAAVTDMPGLYAYTLASGSNNAKALYTGIAATTGDVDAPHVPCAWAVGPIEDTADGVWDELLTGSSHNIANSAGRRLRQLQDTGVYQDGAVWIDTVNGTAGTELYTNGTVFNPVDNIADALTIAAGLNLYGFRIAPESSITLPQGVDGYIFTGFGYTVNLNGQSLSGTAFLHATIIGNDDSSNTTPTYYESCLMGDNQLGSHNLQGCQLGGDMVLHQAGDYFWNACFSGVAGTGSPSVDFQAAVETKNLSVRHYSGGMEFKNFGAGGGTHTASYEGMGQLILNANCAGGTIAKRGLFNFTDNSGGAVTVVDDANYLRSQHIAEQSTDVWLEPIPVPGQPANSAGDYLQRATGGAASSQLLLNQSTVVDAGSGIGGSDADIDAEDGVTWDIQGSGTPGIQVEIVFSAANMAQILEFHWAAGLTCHQNDSLVIEAYHPVNTTWDTISTPGTQLNPTGGAIVTAKNPITNDYIAGDDTVRVRFTPTVSMRILSTLHLDFVGILASSDSGYVLTASEVAEATAAKMLTATYGAQVYLDTVNGVDRTPVVLGEDGTSRYPVQTLVRAQEVGDAVGAQVIHVYRESSLTLAATLGAYTLHNPFAGFGDRWNLDLNSQDISDAAIGNADVLGTYLAATGTPAFIECTLKGIAGPPASFFNCAIEGAITCNAAGVLSLDRCGATENWTNGGHIIFAQASGVIILYCTDYHGPLVIGSMAAGDTAEITGSGTLTIQANCTGGIIKVEGNFQIDDQSGGAVTILSNSNYDRLVHIPEQTTGIWDEPLAGYTTSGTAGKKLDDLSLDNASDIASAVWAESTRTLTAGTRDAEIDAIKAKTDNLPADPASETNVDAVAGEVWDILLANHQIEGSAGEALSIAGSGGVNYDLLADAVWDELLAGHITPDSAGKHLQDSAKADNVGDDVWTASVRTLTAGTKDAEIDAIKAKTDNLPADPAGVSDIPTTTDIWTHTTRTLTAGTKDAEIDAIKAKTDNLPADPAGVSDLDAQTTDVIVGVWNRQTNLHQLAGTFGLKINELENPPSQNLDDYKADVSNLALEATVQAIKTSTDNLPADPMAVSDIPSIADAVWEESQSDHVGANTMGESQNMAKSGGDPDIVADAVWNRQTNQHTQPGSTGLALINASQYDSPVDIAANVWDRAMSLHALGGTFGVHVKELESAPSQVLTDYHADISTLATDTDMQTVLTELDDIQDTLTIGGVTISPASQDAMASTLLQKGVAGLEDTSEALSLVRVILGILNSEIVQQTSTVAQQKIYKANGQLLETNTVDLDELALPITGVSNSG